ncbi:retrovirus-related pol polyprotein from transposon TNT 1-94 [Tanacetum coccineum]
MYRLNIAIFLPTLLKQTLLEHLKEKESLLQMATLLKNDFKKEESRNIDRELALEKQIKHLDNIKAQQSKPKLYIGDIIVQTNPIEIPDSEKTLALAEESRSKMLLKHKDNMMLEKEKENSANSSEPTLSIRPTNVEVPIELPKVSMVNTSLKKLKHHLANFNVVVKERTTPTAITEGVKQSTNASGSQPSGNTKKDKIQQTQSHPKLTSGVFNLLLTAYDRVSSKAQVRKGPFNVLHVALARARRKPHKPTSEDNQSRKTLSVNIGSYGQYVSSSVKTEVHRCFVDDYSSIYMVLLTPTVSPSSTTVDQDAPSLINSQTTPETEPPVIPNDVEEDNHDIEVAHMGNDSYFGDHPLENIIGELARPVSTRLQLHEQALFCYYDAFLTAIEPKTYKDALTQACWIEAMQEELNEFERLEVWELVPRPEKVMVITLKWIYKVKLDELGGILKNKA